VRRVWVASYQRLSAIIYGNYLRTRLKPKFDAAPGERISPFLFSSNDYSVTKAKVHFSAFFPPKSLRKSAYWTSRLFDKQVWSLGVRFVEPLRPGLQIKARADIRSTLVYAANPLHVVLTSQPHPRHVNIVGWSGEKLKDRLSALKLADSSTLVMRPALGHFVTDIETRQDRARRTVGQTLFSAIVLAVLVLAYYASHLMH